MHIYDVFARVGKLAPRCVIAKINIITADSRVARLTSIAPHSIALAKNRAALSLSPYFSNRINSSIDDRFAAILLLSEDLASFERTVAVIAVREIY